MSPKYFNGLNYTLGNEDTGVEISLVEQYRPNHIFSVGGSGGRSLPLCFPFVKTLTCADLSSEQIALIKLRYATYTQLEHQDFLCFWGYFPYYCDNDQSKRKQLFLGLEMEDKAKEIFFTIFTEIKFQSLLYLGKWERAFATLAQINRKILGKDFDRILKFDNLFDQLVYYRDEFPHWRFKLVIFLLGNKALFNALLYKGDFIEKNSPLSHFQYYYQAFERLFKNDLAQKSFFLHLCFYGKINSLAGVPIEASFITHQRIKAFTDGIFYLNEDMMTHLRRGIKKYDFLSLSDVPSYFKGILEKNFMQEIKKSLNHGAIIVIRSYLKKPQCDLSGFLDISSLHQELIEKEKVQMYDISIYKYGVK